MKRKGELVAYTEPNASQIKRFHGGNAQRKSRLQAPIMVLEGHQGDVYSVKFHPDGEYLASAGYDRQIFVWKVYGECENIGVFRGHTGAILDIHFSTDGSHIYSCSTDTTLGIWDLEKGMRVKKLKGHTGIVNSCAGARRGPTKLCSGSDDGTIKLWDPRCRDSNTSTFSNTYQVTAVTFDDTAERIISAGIDNDLKVWDLRTNGVPMIMQGHSDTVTGISLSADGSYALSNGMDESLRVWDIRPYAPPDRCVKTFGGHHHNFEKNLLRCAWSPSGHLVSCGSSDRYVYIWDTTSRRIMYKLPGHNGSVNDVQFHPNEPIIASGSSDKIIFLGEISC